ncbi:DUF4347 domain-containing protein [Amphritea sp. 2_MG-2023]|uniref:DUF4347 domain-containing protein n=1 Tax=Amphritea sp. 2_MG-2023 TaxID=3062682 RepID=UPI0026E137C4|nr:DUF4347 domain-containing protein [Amphritea sp. 2_MG-2023]MDO6420578.1 DUF4347 domain-containing protein [Amphritea sp. 2_MG-2023]
MSEPHTSKHSSAALLLEKAEPRLLLSADPVTSVLSVAMDFSDDIGSDAVVDLDQVIVTDFPDNSFAADSLTPGDAEYPQSLSPDVGLADPEDGLNTTTSVSELIIVDSRVADSATLLESISPNSQNALTIFINPDHDGVESITAALHGYSGIQTIHLISHGSDGALELGSSVLNSNTLSQYSDQLSLWQDSLTDSADILIYGCNVAQSAEGEAFVQALASLTSADIAASDDLTGDASLSGDWQLEYQIGQVDTTAINLADQASWSGVLAADTFWFSTEADVDVVNILQSVTWNDTDIVNFEPVTVPATSIGGFGTSTGGIIDVTGFDIENFIDDENTNIDAIHHVTTDISIGTGTPIELKAGDILLSLADDQTLESSDSSDLDVKKEDVFLFRPDSVGDYSAGTFSLLFTNPSNKDISGLTLVEESTVVGGTSLQAGSFLFTVEGDGSNDYGIHIFNPGDLSTNATNGTVTTLIDGTEENLSGDDLFKDKLVGIELVENDYTISDVDLTAGTILVTLDGDNGVAADDVEGERQDVFALNVSQTTLMNGATSMNASLFFDGSDIGLEENSDSLDAISFYAAQAGTNADPEGGVSINGAAVEDQTLMADVSALSDDDGLGAFSYQWQRDGVAVAGATGNQYQLDDADVGAVINVVVSYMDGGDTHEVVISTATEVVSAVNDPINGLPQINGIHEEGQTLTANTSGISDNDGLSAGFSYQWQRSLDGTNWNDISGATEVNYTLGNADVGQYMRVVVNITDDQGFAEGPLSSSGVGQISGTSDVISGQPEINGTAEEDQTLSADTSGISDPDGLSNNSFTYQWQRSVDGVNWSDLAGATNATYTLDDADVGQYLRVAVNITDDQGFAEGPLVSSATDTVSAINDPIVGLPLISGSAEEDQTLTADISSISDVDGLSNSFSYQWQRSADGVNWSDLAGATNATYTLDDADVGQSLRVAVNITDDQGFAEGPLVSSATDAVSAINDPIVGLPLISGSAEEGQTLTADTGGISDVDGLSNSFSYQWQRSTDGVNWSDLAGATNATYTLDDADVGQYLRVAVNITDDQGFAEGPLVSSDTDAISAINDPIVGLPLINGSATEDQTLTADTSGISDVDGLSNSFSYQWQRSADGVNWSDLAGATGANYTLDDADVGQYLRVAVNIIDDQGFAEGPLVSSATDAISAINDPIVGLPLISGSAAEDQTLTADTSSISDVDGLSSSFSYQWQRSVDGVNWSDLAGATNATYMLGDADVGQYLRVAVNITDDQGFAEGPLVSSATDAVSAINDPIVGLPLISGSAEEDQTLMADTSGISDVDGLSNSFSYQWQRSVDGVNWSDLAGATNATYTLDDADVGQYLRVAVNITDDQGFAEGPLVSSATDTVSAINDPIVGLPLISGSAEEDQTLTADISSISDVDGLSNSFSYQWQRSADGVNWSDLAGATNATYTLDDADVGQYLRVAVNITDDQGFAEGPLVSSATDAVSAINDPIVGLPLISGSAAEDQTLTAYISGISDVDGLSSSFSYQWQRSGDGVSWSDLTGATNATYTLDDADVGQYLRVAVSITDDQGFAEGPLVSSATDAISAVNDTIAGLPLINGSATEDQTLTADISGISDVDGLSNSFNYQWQRSTDGMNWGDLTGATGANYTLDDADVGQYLRVAVSITDDQGFAEGPLISSATAAISAINDPIVGLPLISGSAAEDQTLTADTSGINDVDGLSNSFSYQWQRSADGVNWSDLAGATNATYTLDDADVGQYLRVAVSITDDQGFAEGPLVSSATDMIGAVNDPVAGLPLISGSATEDQTLTADTSGISDVDGLSNSFSYQWQRSADGVNWSDLAGATSATYTLGDADVGQYLRVAVNITDDQGFAEGPLISGATDAISAVNDPIAGLPLINGSATEDQTLTADTSGISDVDGLSNSFSYQWQRSADGVNWSDLAGATNATYTLDDADVGQYLRVAVNITDDQGFAEGPLVSSATDAVSAINDPIVGLPLISGSAAEDQTLTAYISGISDVDGLSSSFSYQWQRSGDGVSWSDLTGATNATYTLDDADVGQYLRVAVSITDDQGFAEGPLVSSATDAISAVNDPIVGLPLISGSATEDQTLTADTSGISDVDGLSNSFSYQWQRSTDGVNWSDLTGATGANYTFDDADVGQYLRVAVSITDDQGFVEGPLISSATDMIDAVNDPIAGLPLINGSAAEDQTLTADISSISDVDGLSNSFSYQWQRSADGVNWSDLAGATGANYTLDDTDVGQYLRVAVSITDDQGFAEGPLVSSATDAVSAINDPIAGLPLISGSATEDQTLTADISSISDVDGLSNSFSYQWQRSADGVNWSDLTGGTNATYTLDDTDVGQYLRVAVGITDDQGFAEGSLVSSATDAISAVNDPIAGLPLINGSVEEGQTLTADTSGISDVDGLSNSFSYQWQRSADGVNWSDLAGATNATYTLDDADVGQYLRVAVNITDDQGFAEGPLVSSATDAVSLINHAHTGSLTISGNVAVGERLILDNTLADPDGISTIAYQWYRSGEVINGATEQSYVLTAADAGKEIYVIAHYVDLEGRAESVTSNQVFLSVPEPESVTVSVPEAEIEGNEQTLDVAAQETADSKRVPEPVVVMESDSVIAASEVSQFVIDVANNEREQLGVTKLNKVIAQEVNTLRLQSILDTMTQPLQLQQFDQFMTGIDQLQQEAKQQHALNTMMVGGSIALSSGLSVGYVIWLARSGVLLSTVLTSLPAWRFIDPLPILSKTSADENNAEGVEQDDESLGSMVEGDDESADDSDDENTDDEDDTDKEGRS